MLWFEDISAINEPVLLFPVIGRISMKQFAILGAAGFATYSLFSGTHAVSSAAPLCAGALLALYRPAAGTPEWMIFSALRFFARNIVSRSSFLIKAGLDRKSFLHSHPRPEPARRIKLKRKIVITARSSDEKSLAVYPDGSKSPSYCDSVEIRSEPLGLP